ncbi:SOS response-associated peptidase [Arthrobacter sp. HLT1-21]
MCGRFVVAGSDQDLIDLFDVDFVDQELPEPSYNVAPTDTVRLLLERLEDTGGHPARRLTTARWGLVPSWLKDPKKGPPLINARAETILEKPSFRTAASRRRGIVMANGYYEWEKGPDGKIPTYLHGQTNDMLAFAALYEYWPDPTLPDDHQDKWLRSCTIITTTASDTLGHIHDRTPLILPPDLYSEWLNPRMTSSADVRTLIDAIPEPQLVPRVVGDAVGSVRNNGPQLIEPAA